MTRQLLAATGLLLIAASVASAQPWSQPGQYDYYQPWSPVIPTNPAGEGYPAPETPSSTEAFYPSTPVEREVTINASVPANAKITFNGVATKQTGSNRHFFSPPIAAGRSYSYVVQASWMKDGRQVNVTRRIPVRAGNIVNLSFGDGSVRVDYGN
jgi:uncharacterized protein (TIGR03000 family)